MSQPESNPQANQDTEFTLTHGNQRATVSPFGASLRGYSVKLKDGREWHAVWTYKGGAQKRGGQGDVLIPFPGRVNQGLYSFESRQYEMIKNDKDGPNAIHGFMRAQLFDVKSNSADSVLFTHRMDAGAHAGYPFSLEIFIEYSLSDKGLRTEFKITNIGKEAAPVAAGFHPYFCADQGELKDWVVTIPARDYVELKNLVPTGRVLPVAGSHLDFQSGLKIGSTPFNDCVAHLSRDADHWATATVASPNSQHKISIRMDEGYDYVVIYTGDQIPAPHARQAFAIEPMTCAPDAFNHPSWGLKTLPAGESFGGAYEIKAD